MDDGQMTVRQLAPILPCVTGVLEKAPEELTAFFTWQLPRQNYDLALYGMKTFVDKFFFSPKFH